MDDGIPIGKVAGIPLTVHWSVLVILWLFTWSLADTLPQAVPGHADSTYWIAGFCGTTALLASLLAHEFMHAVVARRLGVTVLGVRLWVFGGSARLAGEPATPQHAFWIAACGPATSLALAALFALAAVLLPASGVLQIVVVVLWWLVTINVVLGVFNLLPGAPLDGGRILRAYLWRRDGNAAAATVQAAKAGRVLGLVLIVGGLLGFLVGSWISGVWMVFIGWFLYSAAGEEQSWALTRQALAGVSVADVMTVDPRTAPDWISVEDFVGRYLLGDRHSSYPVVDPDGSITGLITLQRLRSVAPDKRATTPLRDAAIPRADVPAARPDEPLTVLMERLAEASATRAFVVESGRIVGLVTPSDVTRMIEVRGLAAAMFSR